MIPLVDLQAQYRRIKPEIDEAVLRLLESAQYILGPAVASFERDFAAFCRTREAIGVNTGTSALHLSLLGGDHGGKTAEGDGGEEGEERGGEDDFEEGQAAP